MTREEINDANDDDINTMRLLFNAVIGDLCNQCRHNDAEEMEGIRDRLIKRLLEKNKNYEWIPVWERLPEKRGDYLVTQEATFTDYVYISVAGYALNLYDVDEYDFADKKRSGWYEYDSEWGYRELDDVIAWMPLPEPYRTESEVQDD